jgi:hypothetical protein
VADVETWLSSNDKADKDEIEQKSNEFKETIQEYATKLGLGQTGSAPGEDYSGENYDDL